MEQAVKRNKNQLNPTMRLRDTIIVGEKREAKENAKKQK